MANLSRGHGQISELFHIAPIKQGNVPDLPAGNPPVRYADRLRVTLEAFQRREEQAFPSVIRLFRGIHTAKWALIDGDTRLLLSVVFDGGLHGYLRALARDIPGMLHLIWSNCEGWKDPHEDSQLLIDFIERHQVRTSYFYAQHTQLTVPDVENLARLRDELSDAARNGRDISVRELQAKLYSAAPISHAERLQQALDGFKNAPESRQGFERLFGALYRPGEVRRALAETYGADSSASEVRTTAPDPKGEIQGNILSEYPEAHCARMLFFHFPDELAARAWLRDIRPLVTFGDKPTHTPYVNIGFTHAGLAALAVNQAILTDFPTAFTEGHDARRTLLGDPPANSAATSPWTKTLRPAAPVHAVVFVHARVGDGLHQALVDAGAAAQAAAGAPRNTPQDERAREVELTTAIGRHLDRVCDDALPFRPQPGAPELLGYQDLHRPLAYANGSTKTYGVEYFGFRDGVGQPVTPEPVVRANEHGLLANATFLVARQLRQYPRQFWEQMEANAAALGLEKRELAERIVGRRLDGRRLDSKHDAFDPVLDQFAFDRDDTRGTCPFHSHVRRANPRIETSSRRNPTLMRRSLAYLDTTESGRKGLMFLAFNADIESQFELIQRNWMQAGNQIGLDSRDRDVLAGLETPDAAHAKAAPARFYAGLPQRNETHDKAAREVMFDQAFVTLEWGEYFYFPAKTALHQL